MKEEKELPLLLRSPQEKLLAYAVVVIVAAGDHGHVNFSSRADDTVNA
jgi:hypothetical protein